MLNKLHRKSRHSGRNIDLHFAGSYKQSACNMSDVVLCIPDHCLCGPNPTWNLLVWIILANCPNSEISCLKPQRGTVSASREVFEAFACKGHRWKHAATSLLGPLQNLLARNDDRVGAITIDRQICRKAQYLVLPRNAGQSLGQWG